MMKTNLMTQKEDKLVVIQRAEPVQAELESAVVEL